MIENLLNRGRSVNYLCPTYQEIDRIWPRAYEYFHLHFPDMKSNKLYRMLKLDNRFVRFFSASNLKDLDDVLRASQSVTILHPQTILYQQRIEELIIQRNHANGQS